MSPGPLATIAARDREAAAFLGEAKAIARQGPSPTDLLPNAPLEGALRHHPGGEAVHALYGRQLADLRAAPTRAVAIGGARR